MFLHVLYRQAVSLVIYEICRIQIHQIDFFCRIDNKYYRILQAFGTVNSIGDYAIALVPHFAGYFSEISSIIDSLDKFEKTGIVRLTLQGLYKTLQARELAYSVLDGSHIFAVVEVCYQPSKKFRNAHKGRYTAVFIQHCEELFEPLSQSIVLFFAILVHRLMKKFLLAIRRLYHRHILITKVCKHLACQHLNQRYILTVVVYYPYERRK